MSGIGEEAILPPIAEEREKRIYRYLERLKRLLRTRQRIFKRRGSGAFSYID